MKEFVKLFIVFLFFVAALFIAIYVRHTQDMPTATPAAPVPADVGIRLTLTSTDASTPSTATIEDEPVLKTPEEQFAEGVTEARAVVKSADRCAKADDVIPAWKGIRDIPKTSKSYKAAVQAAKGLERCRQNLEKIAYKISRDFWAGARKDAVKKMERGFLEKGADIRLSLKGKDQDHLVWRYILVSRPFVYQLMTSGAYDTFQKAGFTKVTFTDGYDETYYYDLPPNTQVTDLATAPLKAVGLDQPFVLP